MRARRFSVALHVITTLILIFSGMSGAFSVDTQNIKSKVVSSGLGGLEFEYNCIDGFLVTGIDANALNWRGKKVISQLRGVCSELNEEGKSTSTNLSYTEISGLAVLGSPSSIDCPKNFVVVGATVFNTSDPTYVAGIELKCGNLANLSETLSTKTFGAETSKSDILQCPNGLIASGLQLRYGEIVDSFGLVCSQIRNAKQKSLTSPVLSSTEKVFPYSENLSISEISGGSGEGKIAITRVLGDSPAMDCLYRNGVLTAKAPGTCFVTITKAGDDFYAAESIQVPFIFSRASETLSITELKEERVNSALNKTFTPIISRSGEALEGLIGITYQVRDGSARGCQISQVSDNTNISLTVTTETFGSCVLNAITAENPFYLQAQSQDFQIDFKDPAESADGETVLRGNLSFQKYDPAQDAKNVVDLQVAAFALLALLASGAAASGFGGESRSQSNRTSDREPSRRTEDDENQSETEKEQENGENERESGDVASASAGKIKFYQRTVGIGDLYGAWKIAHTPRLEERIKQLIEKTARISPVLSRIMIDGSYLRAMFSGLALLPIISGIGLGIVMINDSNQQAIPASLSLILIALGLATLDALAGLSMAITLFIGTAISGNVDSLDEWMTLLGISALLITPGLIANSIRPLRRLINSRHLVWERLTDYTLAILIGGWSAEKIVNALNGLSGIQLPLTDDARLIGQFVGIVIFLRLLLEEIATYLFPERLAAQEAPHATPHISQTWFSLVFKISLFYLVGYQFLGHGNQLLIGTAIFAFPQVLSAITASAEYPKFKLFWFLVPRGAPKLIIMVFVGSFFANWMESLFSSPNEFLSWSFVLLALPGLAIALFTLLARAPEFDWNKSSTLSLTYKFGGIIVAAAILAMYQGVDLYAKVFG